MPTLTLNFSKGRDAGISIRYAESLYVEFTRYGGRKGNRNEGRGEDLFGPGG